MMKKLLNYWREAVCFVSLCLFLGSLSVWFKSPPETIVGKYIFLFLSFALLISFVYLLRQLWLKKWREMLRKVNQMITERVSRFFLRFFEALMKKWNVGSKKKNVIVGKTKIVFDNSQTVKEEKIKKKRIKYKNLESDRERLRFLYRAMITDRIRSGERIRSYETPSELREKRENSENADKLFSMYIGARYNEDAVLNENEIERLKDSLEGEFTIR